jgi:hypothetical protein
MQEEFDSLMENGTWEYQELLKRRKIIKNKWVYKLKLATNESVDRYKARLVAKGFIRKERLDFEETLSLVVKFNSIRMVFSIIVTKDMNITHFDVCTTFLYGEIKEEIYMTWPLGFENIKEVGKVCRLHKLLYGFRLSSKISFSLNIILLPPLLMDVYIIVHHTLI